MLPATEGAECTRAAACRPAPAAPAEQVEQRGAAVNQRDAGRGWTPLMRCARVAHYKNAPHLQARTGGRHTGWGSGRGAGAGLALCGHRHPCPPPPSPLAPGAPGTEPSQATAGQTSSVLLSPPRPAQVFEYLLRKGADASIRSFEAPAPVPSPDPRAGPTGLTGLAAQALGPAPPLLLPGGKGGAVGVLEVAAEKGFGWERGAVRAELARLIDKYAHVPKAPAHVYTGPHLGALLWVGAWGGREAVLGGGRGPGSMVQPPPPAHCPHPASLGRRSTSQLPCAHASHPHRRRCCSAEAPALALLAAWEALPKLYPPANWRPPPPPGYVDAQVGARLAGEGERRGASAAATAATWRCLPGLARSAPDARIWRMLAAPPPLASRVSAWWRRTAGALRATTTAPPSCAP